MGASIPAAEHHKVVIVGGGRAAADSIIRQHRAVIAGTEAGRV